MVVHDVPNGLTGVTGRLVLVLPYPPSVNRLWRRKRGGGMYKVRAAVDYARHVAVRVRLQPTWQTLRPPYRLRIVLWPPDARRRDADNVVKACMDAIWAALGQDDVTVQELHVVRSPAPDRVSPRAEVVIEALGGGEAE